MTEHKTTYIVDRVTRSRERKNVAELVDEDEFENHIPELFTESGELKLVDQQGILDVGDRVEVTIRKLP